MTIGLGPHLRMVSLGVLAHWCPACDRGHLLHMGHRDARLLDWDHNTKAPTFSPDIRQEDVYGICHYFIQGGRILFQSDSSHIMAGRDVALPIFPIHGLAAFPLRQGTSPVATATHSGEAK